MYIYAGLNLLGSLMSASPYVFGRLSQTTPPNVLRGYKLDLEVSDHVIREDLLSIRQMRLQYIIASVREHGLLDRVLKMVL